VKPFAALSVASLIACIGVTTIADATTTATIDKRQAMMKSMARAAKTIGDMFQGKLAYDANIFEAAAELIHANSGRTLLDDFPPGSLGERSQANETIWAQWDEFQILAGRLSVLGAGLAADAAASPDAIGSAMRMQPGTMMGGGSLLAGRPKPLTEADVAGLPAEHAYHLMLEACTSCHAKFRTKRD
jgi:cytochrome c556